MSEENKSPVPRHPPTRIPSVARSLQSQDILDAMHPETGTSKVIWGICRGEQLTNTGKRLQLLKILALTLLPILGLWTFTVYRLHYSIQGKSDIEQTQYAVKFSVEIGRFLDRLQRERDMSVLYLSILGPETKTFLMNEYLLTDQAVDQLSDWPVNSDFSDIFKSKHRFRSFLKDHRNLLDPNNYDIYLEIDFYNMLINRFVEWMYGAIKESNQASIWKILVAYQKIVTSMEHVGIERSLGTVFYVDGGFPSQRIYERYNNRVNNFKANYRSAVLYSDIIDPIFQGGVTSTGTNLTAVIEKFRHEMQNAMYTDASVIKGQYWFDNMTLYLDTLLIVQQDLANLINGELQVIIDAEEKNLIIRACFLVIVILMCLLVIYTVEALTSDIQKYAISLVGKTKELCKEKKRTERLTYAMVPVSAVATLKAKWGAVNAEYFKRVTILFGEVDNFNSLCYKLCLEHAPDEVLAVLNKVLQAIDKRVETHEVYKVETINDCYMIAAGLPTRTGNRHSSEIATMSLDILEMVKRENFKFPGDVPVSIRVGINTGSCISGIMGNVVPRYCLFGDAVKTACLMKTHSIANRIHISPSTYRSLSKHAVFVMAERGPIYVKGHGTMTTYWLTGKYTANGQMVTLYDPQLEDSTMDNGEDGAELPGEILPYGDDPLSQVIPTASGSNLLSSTLDPKSHDDVMRKVI